MTRRFVLTMTVDDDSPAPVWSQVRQMLREALSDVFYYRRVHNQQGTSGCWHIEEDHGTTHANCTITEHEQCLVDAARSGRTVK
jgi:hypothetical protein